MCDIQDKNIADKLGVYAYERIKSEASNFFSNPDGSELNEDAVRTLHFSALDRAYMNMDWPKPDKQIYADGGLDFHSPKWYATSGVLSAGTAVSSMGSLLILIKHRLRSEILLKEVPEVFPPIGIVTSDSSVLVSFEDGRHYAYVLDRRGYCVCDRILSWTPEATPSGIHLFGSSVFVAIGTNLYRYDLTAGPTPAHAFAHDFVIDKVAADGLGYVVSDRTGRIYSSKYKALPNLFDTRAKRLITLAIQNDFIVAATVTHYVMYDMARRSKEVKQRTLDHITLHGFFLLAVSRDDTGRSWLHVEKFLSSSAPAKYAVSNVRSEAQSRAELQVFNANQIELSLLPSEEYVRTQIYSQYSHWPLLDAVREVEEMSAPIKSSMVGLYHDELHYVDVLNVIQIHTL
jgi:hypothetical protein